jgi:hypothetical protein
MRKFCDTSAGLLLIILFSISSTRLSAQEVVTESENKNAVSAINEEKNADLGPVSFVLPFHFTLGVNAGYDDNPNSNLAQSNGQSSGGSSGGSVFTSGNASINYIWPHDRPYITLASGISYTHYPDSTGGQQDSIDATLDLSLVENLTERLQLAATVDVAYSTEPNFSTDIGVENQRANFLTNTENLSAAYSWTQRISTVGSFKFTRIEYDDQSIGFFEDRSEETFGGSLHYSFFNGSTVVVGDYRYEIVDYDSYPRDSTTHYLLGGIDRTFNPHFKASIRGGISLRSQQFAKDTVDPNFETTLTYLGPHNSSLTWTTNYGVEEPNVNTVQSRTTFRTGLSYAYAVTGRITANLTGYYHHDENQEFGVMIFPGFELPGPQSSSDTIDVSFGLRYAINGRSSLNVEYAHSAIMSNIPGQSYSRNHYSAGLTFWY